MITYTFARYQKNIINLISKCLTKSTTVFPSLFPDRRMTSTSGQLPPTSTIDLTAFPVLYTQESAILHDIFRKNGFELRIAGGAVRDILLGITPHDIDFATNATPSEMNKMFEKANIRTLNKNGEAHGTVTVRINDKENFEITTLRIDIEPDGRHSKIIFTHDWRLDAERRDLTVNSMFLSVNFECLPLKPSHLEDKSQPSENQFSPSKVTGYLWDFFNGFNDLQARRIRFVGDPAARIKEDYLRILRYFRFHGRLSTEETHDRHEENILKVISDHASGLASISGERCWSELKKILLFPSAPSLLMHMQEVGIFPYLGLPHITNFSQIQQMYSKGIIKLSPNPATCLAALLSSLDEIETLHNRLHLANNEINILVYIIKKRDQLCKLSNDDLFEFFKRECILTSEAVSKMRLVLIEMLNYLLCDPVTLNKFIGWEVPKFPVGGHLLMEKWNVSNKIMRPILLKLREQWIDSGYRLTFEELLSDQNKEFVMNNLHNLPLTEPLGLNLKRSRK